MTKKIEVSQIEENRFIFIHNTSSKPVEVLLKKYYDDPNPKSLIKTNKQQFELKIENLNYRPYFLIREKKQSYTIGERTLRVEGMNNFRDMGGYETSDGTSVKWGMLYRSDHIHNATDKGVEFLKTLDIHTVIDYRSDIEVTKYPNKSIDENVNIYQLDPSAHAAELSAQFQSSKENEDINLINKIIEQKENGTLVSQANIIKKQYQTFARGEESKKAFSEMLHIIADPKAPAVVQHCRGGKDRTGFGALLVLGILGVSKEDIVEDYLLTGVNRIERNEVKMEGYKKLTDDPEVLSHLYSFIDTKSEFIETSIDEIVNHYGAIEKYVIAELGVSQEEIKRIKAIYCE